MKHIFFMAAGIAVAVFTNPLSLGTLERAAFAQEESNDGAVAQEVANLEQMRRQDPDAFAQEVHNRKERLRVRLEKLKQEDPEKFQAVRQNMQHRRKAFLENLRQTNPEKFREVLMHQRQALSHRLERLKENNPEKYQEIVSKQLAKRQEKLQQLKEKHPEKYDRFVKNHPHWIQRIENGESFKPPGSDRREDVRNRREDIKDRQENFRDWRNDLQQQHRRENFQRPNPPGPRGGQGAGRKAVGARQR